MPAQHRLRPGNAWQNTVADLARLVDERKGHRAMASHPIYDPVQLRALRLVDRGRIAISGDTLWRRHGELTPPLTAALEGLLRDGYITPEEAPDQRTHWRTVVFTEAGRQLFDRWTQPAAVPITPELGKLLALQRVRRGHITCHQHTIFTDHGSPLPDLLLPSLLELIDHGHAQLEEHPEYEHGVHLAITPTGEALLAELSQKRPPTTMADRSDGER